MATISEMRDDYDWREAFEYAAEAGEPTEGYAGKLRGLRLRRRGRGDRLRRRRERRPRVDRGAAAPRRALRVPPAGCDYTGWDRQASGRRGSRPHWTRWCSGDSRTMRGRLAAQLRAGAAVTPTLWPRSRRGLRLRRRGRGAPAAGTRPRASTTADRSDRAPSCRPSRRTLHVLSWACRAPRAVRDARWPRLSRPVVRQPR